MATLSLPLSLTLSLSLYLYLSRYSHTYISVRELVLVIHVITDAEIWLETAPSHVTLGCTADASRTAACCSFQSHRGVIGRGDFHRMQGRVGLN